MNQPTGPRAEILRTRDFVGWTVSDQRGTKVGAVDDILIDRTGKVRFLSINPGLFKKRVLLPVDGVSWGEGTLVLSEWTEEQVKSLPPYDPDIPLSAPVLEELERAYPRFYGARGASAPPTSLEAQIVPLSQAKGFRLSGGSPDVTGWHVFGGDGERVGTVAGMLVDPVANTVPYLAVRLADDLFHLTDERMVVVPVANVDLRERGNDVWVNGVAAADIARMPAYMGGALDPLIIQRVQEAFAHPREFPSAPGSHTEPSQAPSQRPIFDQARSGGDDGMLPGDAGMERTRPISDEVLVRDEQARYDPASDRTVDPALEREAELRRMEQERQAMVSDAPVAPPVRGDVLQPDQLPDRRGDLPGA
jgi:sporulation protein YlmC with PRC-barrel domain